MSGLRRAVWWALVSAFLLGLVMTLRGGLTLDAGALTVPGILVIGPVGAWICARRPGNPVGWLFLTAGTLVALRCWADEVEETLASGWAWTGGSLQAAWFVSIAWFVVLALCAVYLPLLFPEGAQSARWRRVIAALAVLGAIVILASTGPTIQPANGVAIPNPLAMPRSEAVEAHWGAAMAVVGLTTLPIGQALGLGLALRFRGAGAVERQQLRWFPAAAALLLLSFAATFLTGNVEGQHPVWSEALPGVAVAALPVACGAAIMRQGLYAIDRIVSRTVAYAVVTVAVVAADVVVVTSVTRLLPVSGTLAVVGGTLAAAAVFRPLRHRVQGRVDRRFSRSRYDAQRIVDGFGASLRTSVDVDGAAAGLLSAVDRTLQPQSADLRVRPA
jgi:hypothetical protein